MSRKAKLEGNIHDVANRPQPTDSRSATAQQAARRHPIAPSHRASPWPTARRGKYLPASQTGQHQQRQQYQQHQQRSAHGAGHNQGPSHTRVSNNRGPADNRSAKGNKKGGKTALFVVLGLVAIVYIVGVVAFSQIAYPNTTIAGVDISFSNASSAATKVNSAWKHYKLTVSGDDFSWTYQPESDEPIVDGEAAAHEIIGSNDAAVAFAPDCLARRQER